MSITHSVTFERLAKMPLVRDYEEAFRKATGIALTLVRSGVPTARLALGEHENPFCALVSSHPALRENCRRVEAQIQLEAGRALTPRTCHCMAGLHLVAAPVAVGGRHVATWIGGQVFQKQPTEEDFHGVLEHLTRLGVTEELSQLKSAFFRGRLVAAEQFQASTQLLKLFAQHLGQNAEQLLLFPQTNEPQFVARAKEFIQSHLAEPLSLKQLAAAVHISPFHFCRVFRAATGFTPTEYVSRSRVEKAKTLLSDGSMRISEVAFAVGFGSLSQFNSVFRRCLGMSPTLYRARKRRSRN